MSKGILCISAILLLVTVGMTGAGFLVFDKKRLAAWQDKVRKWTYRNVKPACSMREGRLYWNFSVNDPKILQNFIGFIIWGGLAYIIFFTPYSYAYLPDYHSWKEIDVGVWFLLILFSSTLTVIFFEIILGFFRDYAVGIILDENTFTVQYKSGKSKTLSYSDIANTEFKLWRPGARGSEIFYPTFYFYDSDSRLICKAEVLDLESYLLLFQKLNAHGLHYIEPSETPEAYRTPPAMGYQKRK